MKLHYRYLRRMEAGQLLLLPYKLIDANKHLLAPASHAATAVKRENDVVDIWLMRDWSSLQSRCGNR